MFYECCFSLKASGQARFTYIQLNENINDAKAFFSNSS